MRRAISRIQQSTSPNGERREYVYDDANRRTTETHYPKNSTTASQTVIYTYDARNLLSGDTQSGDTHSSAVYVYDAKGQKLDETVTYGSGPQAFSKAIHYAYEPNGLKKSLTYPDGTVQTSTYDKNRLASIAVRGNTIRYQDYQWRMPTKVTMPGATRTLTYDPLQRPTQIRSVSVAGAVIMDYRYTYDAAGNITQRETEDGDYLYSYDALDRLTGATPPVSLQQSPANPNGLPVEQYTYDPVYNRKTSAHQPGSWSYNANNELSAYGTGTEQQSYRYDANGNTIEQKSGDPQSPSRVRTFIYNAGERLSEVQDNGGAVGKYQYDPLGRRIRKETIDGVTWFQYSDEGIIAEHSRYGDQTRIYGWKPGKLWGSDPVWLMDGVSLGVNFYHNDYVGNPRRITSNVGEISWVDISDAFGTRDVLVSAISNNLGFPGQYYDSETGSEYNYYRAYDSSTGRYMQNDPLGIHAGVNGFIYSSSNPINNADPYGLSSFAGGLCEKTVTGSLTDLTPSSNWITNIHFKTVYINLPDGGQAAVIGRYIIASSGSFSLGIRCNVNIICCRKSVDLQIDINVESPIFSAEYEYEEIEGIMPLKFLPRALAAAKVAKTLYNSVKRTKEFSDWYEKNSPDALCNKAL